MLARNIAVGGLLIVLFAGLILSLTSVARLRGFTPAVYVFSQPPDLLARLTDENVAACIDVFSDGVCAHLDYLRQIGEDRYELTTHVSAVHALFGGFDEKRIIVSKIETVLRDNRLCLPAEGEKERLFFYTSADGKVIPDAQLRQLDKAGRKIFHERLGFEANDWTCMEYVVAPDWLSEDGILRRGFKNGVLTGTARRVTLAPASQEITLSTQ